MALIDFILNLAALLLWLSWRSFRLERLVRNPPATLAGTLKRAEPRRAQSWPFLLGLIVLLGFRGLLYWELVSPGEWTPRLDLGLIVLPFRSDVFAAISFYSLLSFLRVLVIFYFWLVTLAVINGRATEPDPIQKLVRLHLGWVTRWPWPVQLALPLMAGAGLWLAGYPLLVHLGVIDPAHHLSFLLAQGCLIGLALVFTLKFLLPPFLFLHLILSYVFLGSHPLWDFISATAGRLLLPLRRVRVAKLDFSPLAGVALILILLHWLPDYLLARLAAKNVILWPQ
jgi:hypothetical protein